MAEDVTLALIRDKESFSPSPYWDVNAWRIGYGSDTMTDAAGHITRVTKDSRTTVEAAERDLRRRVPEFQKNGIIKHVGQSAWDALPAEAKAAVTSLAYNYGSLSELPSLRKAIKSGDPQQIAKAIKNRGGDNGGQNRSRRNDEAALAASAKPITATARLQDIHDSQARAFEPPPPLPRARPGNAPSGNGPVPPLAIPAPLDGNVRTAQAAIDAAAPRPGYASENIAGYSPAVPPPQDLAAALETEVARRQGSPAPGPGTPATGFNTVLSPADESRFRAWKAQVAPNDSGQDYDFRGAFAAGVTPAANGHWPDTYKKPSHETFSVESQYAKFASAQAGRWDGDTYIPRTASLEARDEAAARRPQVVPPRPARATPRRKEAAGGVTAPPPTPAPTAASQAAAAPAGSFTGDLVAFLEDRARAQVTAKPATGTPKVARVDPIGTAPSTYGVNAELHPAKVTAAKDELRSLLADSMPKPVANKTDVVSKRGADPIGTTPTARGVSKVATAKDELEQLLRPTAPGTMTRPAVARPAVAMTAPGATRAAPATAKAPVPAIQSTHLASTRYKPGDLINIVGTSGNAQPVPTRSAAAVPAQGVVSGKEVAPPPTWFGNALTPAKVATVAPKVPDGYQPIQPINMDMVIPDVAAPTRAKVANASIPATAAEKAWAQTGFDRPVVAPFKPAINDATHAAAGVQTTADAAWGATAARPAPTTYWTNPKGEKYKVGSILEGSEGTTYEITSKGPVKRADPRALGDGSNILAGAINAGIKGKAADVGAQFGAPATVAPKAVVKAPVPAIASPNLRSAPVAAKAPVPAVASPNLRSAPAATLPATVPFPWPDTAAPVAAVPPVSWWGGALTSPKAAVVAKPKAAATPAPAAVTTAPRRIAIAPNPAIQSGGLAMRRATTAPGTGESYANPGGTGLGVLFAKVLAAATGIDISNVQSQAVPSQSFDGQHFMSGVTPGAYYDDQAGWQVKGQPAYNSGGGSGLSSGH